MESSHLEKLHAIWKMFSRCLFFLTFCPKKKPEIETSDKFKKIAVEKTMLKNKVKKYGGVLFKKMFIRKIKDN
jgi:hypothetical protein